MREGRVARHPTRGPGYAQVLLPGAAAYAPDPRFRMVWEASAHPNLGPRGWQSAEAVLHPEEVQPYGQDLVLTLGPEICEHLVSENYELVLLAAQARFVLPWIEIPHRPSDRRGGFVSGAAAPARAASMDATLIAPRNFEADATIQSRPPLPMATEAPPPPVAPPAPPVAPAGPPPPGRRGLIAILAILLLLAIAAAALWWFVLRPEPEPTPAPAPTPDPPARVEDARTDPAPPPTPSPAPTPPAQPQCREALGAVASWPQARAILRRTDCQAGDLPAIAGALQEAGRSEDALQILEYAVERGVGPAMTMLARLYDPTGFQPGHPFAEPDIRQAARFYADAARAGDSAAEAPRAALRALLQERAQGGDMLAELTLRDYWP